MERGIQIAVARADLVICQVLSWPWRRLGLSVLIAAVVIHVIKEVRHGERGDI